MTILICGAQGQVGRELAERAGDSAVAMGRQELDISDPDSVHSAIHRVKPTVVINAAAYTAVDKAETDEPTARRINAEGPEHLARACSAVGSALLHISTDYVFDGRQGRPYREDDAVNPLGVYAKTKWEGELAVRRHCDRHIILRTSWVFGAHGNNFVRTMLRLAREQPELRVVADQQGGPTPAADIAQALLTLAERVQAGESLPWGTFHFSGSPATTWHGLACATIDEAYKLGLLTKKPDVRGITTSEYPLPAPRPANSVFDSARLENKLRISPPDWRVGLHKVLQSWTTPS